MMTTDQEQRLKEVTAETLGVAVDDVDDETSPETLAEWTSLTHLNLMSAVEDAFGIMFSMEEMTEVHTYSDLHRVVSSHL